MKKISRTDPTKFYEAILTLKTKEECAAFFNDVCTIQELEALAQRIDVVLMLSRGKSYVEINKELGVSTATISRVSKYLNYGAGGYETVLKRMENENV